MTESVRITDAFYVKETNTSRSGRYETELLKPIEYHVGHHDSAEIIIVPAGYVTDFASVPRGLWNLFPPLGRWARAAIVHDYLYSTGGLYGRYNRKQADKIFLEIMTVLEVPAWKRQLMYWAVRLGGGSGWSK